MQKENRPIHFGSEPYFGLDHRSLQDRKRPPRSAEVSSPSETKGEFEEQEPSSFEQRWTEFMQIAVSSGAFLLRPSSARAEVWLRQKEIIKSKLEGEGIEIISRRLKKNAYWVENQLRLGTERVWNNSPVWLRERYPKERILPSKSEKIKQKRIERESTLIGQLQREDLNKEELEELMAKVGFQFYRRHRDLFDTVVNLARKFGFRSSPRDIDILVDVLEKDGGIVVGAVHGRGRKIRIFLKQDYEDARETLISSEKLSNLVE